MERSQTGLCAPERVARVVRAGTRLGTSLLEIAVEAVFSSMLARLQFSRTSCDLHTCNFAQDKLRVTLSGLEKHSVTATAVYATQSVL